MQYMVQDKLHDHYRKEMVPVVGHCVGSGAGFCDVVMEVVDIVGGTV